MPYYLKRFLIKQFLNNYNTLGLKTKCRSLGSLGGGLHILSLSGVSKSFNLKDSRYYAVDRVSLEVRAGTIHGIIGASGAGKSTLLRLINLLERPDAGTVAVSGRLLTEMPEKLLRKERQKIGMIFQQFNLVGNATVSRNVAIPLELAGVPRSGRMERVRECLQFVGLEDKAGQYPARLSGGQRQRVAIARALANSPKLLLCDEPTSALDPGTTADILGVLQHINTVLGVTIVIVTHELDVVRSICTDVSVMEGGRIIDSFSREDGGFLAPAGHAGSYRERITGKAGEAHV
ncbi:ATP-binding cassette domain-containing protein [Paenibacillus sp. S150]|nr:ATP-binding cassette domain-containing protein [Paenibacillus sp. S150]